MIAGLILAAGESRRMGRDKALLIFQGRTFLESIVANLRAGGVENIIVVLGHHAEAIQGAVDLTSVQVVVNPDYQRGQTSSLQLGLAAAARVSPDAVLLCLVDHPAFSASLIAKLLEQFEATHAPVVIPTFQGERGHPVVIGRLLIPELLELPAGAPANAVIRRHRHATQFVEVSDPGVLLDVDDPEAYARLEESGKIETEGRKQNSKGSKQI